VRIHPTLQQIVEESNGEIAWVYRHLPLESIHPEALPSAVASECIAKQKGNEAFWKFADAMFAEQSTMNAAEYVALAGQFGANVQQFSACMASGEFDELIAGQALDAQKNGGTGTPFTVVVKGDMQVPISGALPYAQIKAVINSVQSRQ
jgi:protein-disulfide isomerase